MRLAAFALALALAGCIAAPAQTTTQEPASPAGPAGCPLPCLEGGLQLAGPGAGGVPGGSASWTTYATGFTGAEPSIGVSPSGTTIYIQAGFNTIRSTTSGSTWLWISPLATDLVSFDPMMYYDPVIDNLYVDQLDVACTIMAYHENPTTATSSVFDVNWRSNPAACGLPGIDHQKLEGGPSPTLGVATSGRSLYMGYSQAGGGAVVAKSVDHGWTWTSHSAIFSTTRGSFLWPTGPVTADPAGTYVYLPAHGPSGLWVATSSNEGLTYNPVKIPVSTGVVHAVDPEVAVDSAGNAYVIWWSNADFQLRYSYSTNHGASWSLPIVITTPAMVSSTIYPTAVARSPGKLDVAFLGTPTSTAGPDACPASGAGACKWYLYMAQLTAANSATPTVALTQITPATDPVQIGRICTGGTGCASARNLLDFIDIEVDGSGWAHIAYTDGCTGSCSSTSTTQSNGAAAMYARQNTGTAI
jgi:hypothetical protein